MTVAFDPSGDLALVADGLESVTLTHRLDGSTDLAENVLQRAVSLREAAASNGDVRQGDVRFHLPAGGILPATAPVPGDTLTPQDKEVWTVLDVSTRTLKSRYACLCRNLAITERLDTLITIQRATYTKGAGGAQEATWADLFTALRARIQPLDGDEETRFGRRSVSRKYRLFLLQEIAIQISDRVVGSDGTVYRVTGMQSPERIDELFQVLVERDEA